MTCLLSEVFPLLLDEGQYDPQARRDALRVCEGLLNQRPVIMKELLAPEVRPVRLCPAAALLLPFFKIRSPRPVAEPLPRVPSGEGRA